MDYLQKIKEKAPLIHCITNTVTVNDCANALLAIGARPVMAEHPMEAAEITAISDALLINTGSVTDSKIKAMRASAQEIGSRAFVMDCVGASSSSLRRSVIRELLQINTPRIIKGNASEIVSLYSGEISCSGVDAAAGQSISGRAVMDFAKSTGAVIAVTGKEDIITDGKRITRIKNGSPMLSKITGTGCILGCIMAALMSVTDEYSAAVYAAALMGICGEQADTLGAGTFHVSLMDRLSQITDREISENIKTD